MTNAIAERKMEELASTQGGEHLRNKRVFAPRADIYETEDTIVVLADMPGVNENSIDITLEKNVLTIYGIAAEQAEEGLKLVYCECLEGDYRRVFLLSEEVDRNGIKATVKNGVLKLILPKSADLKARKITVKAE
ncbi:MAG: Hsp20/alpha crystallin family protein [Candidatus Obscuribacterales bacterium]|nr:Hsp20/alpha crystallin family protein [Candidatus Obscuribacterales bacterium]